MAKGLIEILIDRVLDDIMDADWVGRRGEKLTENELKLVKLFGRKGKILRNIYIPKDNGETSEIDVLFITQKGLFVIESKNYSGWIFGDEKSTYWTVMLSNKTKNKFYNPVMQNRTHIKWLDQYLNHTIPLFSIIAFSERCELKKVSMVSSDIHVIKRDRMYATIRSIWDSNADSLDDKQVDEIYEQLKVLTNVDEAVKAAHIKSIQERYIIPKGSKSPEIFDNKAQGKNFSEEQPKETESPKCPKCGANLILRTASKGANAGKNFYGCSNFPKCKYIQNI